MCFN
jgi:hypothetical protein